MTSEKSLLLSRHYIYEKQSLIKNWYYLFSVHWNISYSVVNHAVIMFMIEFFFPNSGALFPIFCTDCPDGSHFVHMGSCFAQNITTNP